MAKNFSLFPTFLKNRVNDIFTIPYPEFSYTRGNINWNLKIEDDSTSKMIIKDEKGYWNADDYNLIIDWNFTYKNAYKLYDVNDWEYACACSNSKIGVAMSWYSSDSKRRDTIQLGCLEKDDKLHSINFNYNFDKSELRGEVGFSLILYLAKSGTPNSDELHFANTQGVILGELFSISICLDGNGSYFTIYEVSRPGEPLWSVEYNIDDPSVDLFSECVSISINRAHKQYALIKKDSDQFCPQLFIEIMASAISSVIETVRSYEKDDNFDCMSSFEDGSVAQALKYFKEKLGWNFSSPITVSNSARSFIEKNIKSL